MVDRCSHCGKAEEVVVHSVHIEQTATKAAHWSVVALSTNMQLKRPAIHEWFNVYGTHGSAKVSQKTENGGRLIILG